MLFYVTLLWYFLKLTSAAEPPGGYYTTRYDHLDIENILNQKRLVQYYAACLLDKGPCTPQGIEFKRILPEAIKTNCLRCTEKQRVITLRSIRRLRKEYPDIWAQLEASWDPSKTYVKQLEESVNKPISIPATLDANDAIQNVVPLSNRFDDITERKRFPESITTETIPTVSTLKALPVTQSTVTTTTSRTTTVPRSTEAPSTTTTPTSTTLKLIISTLQPRATTTKFSTSTSFFRVTKRIVSRPFSSIGPNLLVPNPKAIIDKVISTAGAVLNSVTNTVTNTVVTVFKW